MNTLKKTNQVGRVGVGRVGVRRVSVGRVSVGRVGSLEASSGAPRSIPRSRRAVVAAATVAMVTLALLTRPLGAGGGGPVPGEDPLVPDQVIVRLSANVELSAALAMVDAAFPGTTVLGSIASRSTFKFGLPSGSPVPSVDALLAQMVANGTLVWGELNYEGQAAEGKAGDLWSTDLGGAGSGAYSGQYAGELLGLREAHATSRGQGVLVAVLDTGVDPTHPALAAQIGTGGASFVAGAGLDDLGTNEDNDGDGLIDEMTGHGTFVAGLILLVAPEATLVPITVLDSEGIGDTLSLAQGIYHAIDGGAHVINCSFGSTYKGAAVEDAIDEAVAKGIVVVGAAGNFDREDPEEYPAMASGVIGVGATRADDVKAGFSNYNPDMVLCAPGESELLGGGGWDIARSVISALPGGEWGVWRGTSFSTGFVSGAAALVRAQLPSATPNALLVATITSRLQTAAVPIDDLNPRYQGLLGSGRLDAAATVALGDPAPTPGDLDANGAIDGADLGLLLSVWGDCLPGLACPADLTLDGTIDGADLGALLANWG